MRHHATMSSCHHVTTKKIRTVPMKKSWGFRPCSSHPSTSLSRKKLTSWPERKLHLVTSLSCPAVMYCAPFRNGQKSSCTSQSVWMVGSKCKECLVCINFANIFVWIGLNLRISEEPLVCWQTPDSWTDTVACREVHMKCTDVTQIEIIDNIYYGTVLLWVSGM